MHLDDVPAAGARVQQVDVLRDHRLDETALLELCEREVRRVRLRVTQHVDALAIEAPDASRVAPERLDRRDLERIDLGPDPGVGAEVRDPRLRRHARAGEHDARLPVADERC